MNNKHHKGNNQLSLALELPSQFTQVVCPTVSPIQQRSGSVIAFPTRQSQVPSFRERALQELVKTRVMVTD